MKTEPKREFTERDKAELQALIKLYEEQAVHGRHTETQRQAISAALLIAAGAFVTAISALSFSVAAAPLAILMILLGFFGLDFVSVYEFKWDELTVRRTYYREKIQALAGIVPVPTEAHKDYFLKHRGKSYAVLRKSNELRVRWRRIFAGVSIVGVVLLLTIGAVSRGLVAIGRGDTTSTATAGRNAQL